MKLTLDKSSKVEICYIKPSTKIRNLESIDTMARSFHAPSIIVDQSMVESMNMMRFSRNSQYKLLSQIDHDGKIFGNNKIHEIRKNTNVDGYEIGMTIGKNENELFNEISAIHNVFIMYNTRYFVRWIVRADKGMDHFDNCMKALARAKSKNINYEIITISCPDGDKELIGGLVKRARKLLNLQKAKLKIKTKFDENVMSHDSNLIYEFDAQELI